MQEIHIDHPQTEPFCSNGLHMIASELSFGTENGRTLNMKFDAMLAAEGITGIQQAANTPSGLDDTAYSRDHQQQQQLPDMQEDHSPRNSSFVADQYNDPNLRALVRVGDIRPASTSSDDSRMTNGLTMVRQGEDIEAMHFKSILGMPLSSRSLSHGSRKAESEENYNMQIVPTTLTRAQSPDAGHGINNNDDDNSAGLSHRTTSMPLLSGSSRHGSRRAESEENNNMQIVSTTLMRAQSPDAGYGINNKDDDINTRLSHTTCASNREADHNSRSSPPSILSASSSIKEKNTAPMTNPVRQALEKVRRVKVFAQALAYQDAKNSQYDNRYRRAESTINAWENQQRIKANVSMKKVEIKLEEKRAEAFEKTQNEIARAHKKAEQKKASALAVRAVKTAKVAEVADNMRKRGKVSSGCLPF